MIGRKAGVCRRRCRCRRRRRDRHHHPPRPPLIWTLPPTPTKIKMMTKESPLAPLDRESDSNLARIDSILARAEQADEFGLYEPSFEDSLCSKFGEFTVVHEYEGGEKMLRSERRQRGAK